MNVRKRNARIANSKIKANCLSYLNSREYGKCHQLRHIDLKTLPQSLPYMWDGQSFHLQSLDKVFASQWLSVEEILIGTKCNRLSLLNCRENTFRDIPLLEPTARVQQSEDICGSGIHAIQKNPSETFVATGGKNVTTVGIYSLPDLAPRCIFQRFHQNSVFDLRWLDDVNLATCSRDSRLALWRAPCEERLYHDPGPSITTPRPIPNHPSVETPVAFTTSSVYQDRLRALELLPSRSMLAVVSMSHKFYLYDIDRLFRSVNGAERPLRKVSLDINREAVALRRWPSSPHVVALATQRSVLLFDVRCRSQIRRMSSRCVGPPFQYSACIRSLNFAGDVMTYGTSSGKVFFYDLVADKHLPNHLDMQTEKRQPNFPACSEVVGNNNEAEDENTSTEDSLPDLAAGYYGNSPNRSPSSASDSGQDDTMADFHHPTDRLGSAFSPRIRRWPWMRLERANPSITAAIDQSLLLYLSSMTNRLEHRIDTLSRLREATVELQRRAIASRPRRDPLFDTSTIFPAGGAIGDGSVSIDDHNYARPSDDEMSEDESLSAPRLLTSQGPVNYLQNPFGQIDAQWLEREHGFLFSEPTALEDFGYTLYGVPQSVGSNIAVYTHEYDSSGTRLFTAGGPIGSAFDGNFAVLWH